MKTVMVFPRDGERQAVFQGSAETCQAYITGYADGVARSGDYIIERGQGREAQFTFLTPRLASLPALIVWAE